MGRMKDLRETRGLVLPLLMMLELCCISPGAGMVGSFRLRLLARLDRLRRSEGCLAAELLLGRRRPALMVAAAWSLE